MEFVALDVSGRSDCCVHRLVLLRHAFWLIGFGVFVPILLLRFCSDGQSEDFR